MPDQVYKQLCQTMAARRGRYPGADIPEFYAMVEVLFTPEEAAVSNAMPKGFSPAKMIAAQMGKTEEKVAPILEAMADKGLCSAGRAGDTTLYGTVPFVPGIFEFQFMRGTATEWDKKLAKLIKAYKDAYDAAYPPSPLPFPTSRVVTVDRKIMAGNTIHTYDQVAAYVEKYEPLAVSSCFCRHQARLIDESSHCGKPDDVCMQFGAGAQFVIDRKMGKRITKEEAMDILRRAEEAGLVHATINRQEIDFLCNCCACHCVILKTALAYPKPGASLNSGFKPTWNEDLCVRCETCIDRCPTGALSMNGFDVPDLNPDRCIGCGVCATGCPQDAIGLVERSGIPAPPVDQKALSQAVKAAFSSSGARRGIAGS
jgi:Pyruvate/2-oxoacid:ferredoxin oxidoreductase delta subunit